MLSDHIEKIEKRLVSLDIETTGLTLQTDRIWSIGIAKANTAGIKKRRKRAKNDLEIFIDPRSNGPHIESTKESIEKLMIGTSGSFAEGQIERGSFEPLIRAIDSGKTKSEQEALDIAFKNLHNKIILIQNHNFENRFLGKALGQEDAGLSGMFRYNTVSPKNPNNKLFTPPRITQLRSEAQSLTDAGADIGEISSVYDRIMAEYEKEILSPDTGSFIMEEMDFSKALFAKAGKRGLINPKMYDANTSIEFLGELIGKREEHTALEDGRLQTDIWKEFVRLHDELSTSSPISPKTKKLFESFNTSISKHISNEFSKGLEGYKREIDNTGSTRLIDEIPISSRKIDIDGPEGRIKLSVPIYDKSYTTGDMDEAVSYMVDEYSGKMSGADMNKEINAFYKKNNMIIGESLSKTMDKNQKTPIITGNDSKKKGFLNVLRSMKTTKYEKGIILGVAGLVAYSLSGSDDKKEKDEKNTVANKSQVFDIYNPNRVFKDNTELNRHYLM